MKKIVITLVMIVGITILPSNSYAQTNQQIADEIISMVKAQWTASIADPGNVAEQFKNTADDYTEFNSDYSTRLDGKAIALKMSEASSKDPGRTLASEMLNPKVQIYGDVAIISYNYAGLIKNKDGETKPSRAKSTRVYAKQGGKWKMVHANFGADPIQD